MLSPLSNRSLPSLPLTGSSLTFLGCRSVDPAPFPSLLLQPRKEQPHKAPQLDTLQGSNCTLQLFQCTLKETLDSFQKSIHGDMRNLHIEILRQFHMQEIDGNVPCNELYSREPS